MAEAKTDAPRFEVVAGCFKVTLFPIGGQKEQMGLKERSDVTENVTENVTEEPRKIREMLLLDRMGTDGTISVDELSEILSVSRRTILRDIKRLKQHGLLRRVGPDKGGYWQVIEAGTRQSEAGKRGGNG